MLVREIVVVVETVGAEPMTVLIRVLVTVEHLALEVYAMQLNCCGYMLCDPHGLRPELPRCGVRSSTLATAKSSGCASRLLLIEPPAPRYDEPGKVL